MPRRDEATTGRVVVQFYGAHVQRRLFRPDPRLVEDRNAALHPRTTFHSAADDRPKSRKLFNEPVIVVHVQNHVVVRPCKVVCHRFQLIAQINLRWLLMTIIDSFMIGLIFRNPSWPNSGYRYCRKNFVYLVLAEDIPKQERVFDLSLVRVVLYIGGIGVILQRHTVRRLQFGVELVVVTIVSPWYSRINGGGHIILLCCKGQDDQSM
mmetsp:Transcript_8177/g.20107  ORF Transcript_8177/g.20107 Transcript_8177/m.20107 type:complete len:208 (+) Transcript_8177:428-1051(+)